jgi:hypothetical protein
VFKSTRQSHTAHRPWATVHQAQADNSEGKGSGRDPDRVNDHIAPNTPRFRRSIRQSKTVSVSIARDTINEVCRIALGSGYHSSGHRTTAAHSRHPQNVKAPAPRINVFGLARHPGARKRCFEGSSCGEEDIKKPHIFRIGQIKHSSLPCPGASDSEYL